MVNPEKLATWGMHKTQDENKQNIKKQHRKQNDEQHGLHQKPRVNPGTHRTSYKTHTPCYLYSQYMLSTTIRKQAQIT